MATVPFVESRRRLRFTSDDYDRLAQAGLFADRRVELWQGELIEVGPPNPPHAGAVRRLTYLLIGRVPPEVAVVWPQNPVRVSDDWTPMPDVALLRPPAEQYDLRRATASDVLLLIEVADSTLEADLREKVPAYARAGVAEVWIVDLNGGEVLVHRQPHRDGSYELVTPRRSGETVRLLLLDAGAVSVDELLGKAGA